MSTISLIPFRSIITFFNKPLIKNSLVIGAKISSLSLKMSGVDQELPLIAERYQLEIPTTKQVTSKISQIWRKYKELIKDNIQHVSISLLRALRGFGSKVVEITTKYDFYQWKLFWNYMLYG